MVERVVAGRRLLLAGLLLLGACTTTRSTGGITPPPPPPDEPSLTVTATAEPGGYARPCDSSVYGRLGRRWQEQSLVVGPVAFVGLPLYERAGGSTLDVRSGSAVPLKVLAVVKDGTRVTVSVPPDQRESLALLYDPAAFGARSVGDGQTTVTFGPCQSGATRYGSGKGTQFNGALLVTGPQCAALEIDVDGGATRLVTFPLGRGVHCPT